MLAALARGPPCGVTRSQEAVVDTPPLLAVVDPQRAFGAVVDTPAPDQKRVGLRGVPRGRGDRGLDPPPMPTDPA